MSCHAHHGIPKLHLWPIYSTTHCNVPSKTCTFSYIIVLSCVQVLEELPSNLIPLVLGATPKTLMFLLPLLPQHLHMEALLAVHPTITTHGTMTLVQRDEPTENDSVLWALLPKVTSLKHITLDNVSGSAGLGNLAPHLARLSGITYLSLRECDSHPDDYASFGSALGGLTGLQHLSLAGMHLSQAGAQIIAPHLVHLTRLTHLDVSSNQMGVLAAIVLAVSLPALASLKELILQDNHMLDDGFEAIVLQLSALPDLELLNVQNCAIGVDGMNKLASQLHALTSLKNLLLVGSDCRGFDPLYIGQCLTSLVDLQCLDLRGLLIGARGIRALLQPLSDPHPLRQLQFVACSQNDEGAAEVAQHLPKFIHLEHLNVMFNRLTTEGSKLLAPSLEKLTALTNIYFGSNHMSANSAAVLTHHIAHLPRLKHLTLCNVSHKVGSIAVLAEYLSALTALQYLDLGDHMMPTIGDVLAAMPFLAGLAYLQHLNLCNTHIGATEAALVAQHITALVNLTHLDLHGNPLESEGLQSLVPALCQLTALQVLDLSSCGITGDAEGATAFCSCLSRLKRLTSLVLTGNSLADTGAAVLSQHLSHLSRLEALFLTRNSIHLEGIRALVPEANQLTSLTWLDLRGNHVGAHYVHEHAPHLCLNFIHYESSIVCY